MYMLQAIIQDDLRAKATNQRGAGLAEYAMLLLLITIITATVVSTLGGRISSIFDETCEELVIDKVTDTDGNVLSSCGEE